MAKLDICTECDQVVHPDSNDENYVELADGTTMHADCYEDMKLREQEEEKQKQTA